jgi:hypothetical protein
MGSSALVALFLEVVFGNVMFANGFWRVLGVTGFHAA